MKAKSQLMHPQEVEVLYILPTIRKELAISMKELGLSQKKIAGLLGVRESTISQYITAKRATKIELGPKLKKEVKKSAKIINNTHDSIKETQRILDLVRESKLVCDIHKQMADIPNECDMCGWCKHE